MTFLWRAALAGMAVLPALLGSGAATGNDLPRYMGSQTCGTCHRAELQAWSDSHHGWALREPVPDNVLGDFDNAEFEHKGIVSRFFSEGGRYFVETDGADGRLSRFEIRYVVGVDPLQQYLVEIDGGRLQALDIAWDTVAKRWYHLYPDQEVSAGNGLHWTGAYKNWQARCAVCHQTDFRKNYQQATRTYQSDWSELTVGCEACHGPGEAHVACANKADAEGASPWTGLRPNGLVAPRSTGRQAIEQDMCGPCHSRRDPLVADSTLPSSRFADHFQLTPLNGLYFPDGQQDQEVYILGSFLQSKMHKKGVTCSNCHDPHSAGLIADGNAVCTQCHNEAGRKEFPSLVLKDYDSPDHHRHAEGSEGARCVSCHMPERTYMTVDARRDHFFRVPDPMLSKAVGSPDACLTCHTDKPAEWAASSIRAWAPDRPEAEKSVSLLFAGVANSGLDPDRISSLASVARDDKRSDIVRITALRDLNDQVDTATAVSLAGLLADDSAMVRAAAARLWRSAPPEERVARLSPLLEDSFLSVRVAAALELAAIDAKSLPESMREPLRAALAELRAAMQAKADFPEGQVAIGGLAMATQNWDAAQSAFSEAVFMDPQLVDVWLMRARVATALGDNAEAAAILIAARANNPDDLTLAGQGAQLLLEQGRLADAIPFLRTLVLADPSDDNARINLAFALLQTGDVGNAGAEIDRLYAESPDRAEVLMLRGLHQLATGDAVAARETVRDLGRLYPNLRLPPQLEALGALP